MRQSLREEFQDTLLERIHHVEKFLEKLTTQPVPPPLLIMSSTTQAIPVSKPSNSTQNVPHSDTNSQPESATTEPQVQTNTITTTHTPHKSVSRLPKLNLPSFSDDPLLWQTFWDTFNAAINNNPSLGKVQKFSYLWA